MDILIKQSYLNFVIDESDNQHGDQVMNISVHLSKLGFFYLKNKDLEDKNATADNLTNEIIEGLLKTCNNDLTKVNSIVTDTCNTMKSVHEKLAEDF